ncbi:MAG: PASTA domain-containing protein [Chloroflexales bacterium]
MDFIGGALPNVMFLIGVIAIGIGVGLEFKIIEVKNSLSRNGRIGAGVVGIALVATSIALYLRPQQVDSSTPQTVVAVPQGSASVISATPSTSLPAQGVASQAVPTAPTEAPTTVPTEASTAIPSPSSTPTPTAIPLVTVPDIRGMSPKDAEKALMGVGLEIGARQPSCANLNVDSTLVIAGRKDRIACQSPAPASNVPQNSTVTYALSDEKKP